MSDYFKDPRINWTSLKNMLESPLVYKHRLEHEMVDTAALAMGRLTHTLVFEPEKFGAAYAVFKGKTRRGKVWDEFRAENEGKTIFKPDEIGTAVAMADAVRNHPLVVPYLDGGLFEHAIFWTDPDTGLECKGRPDWIIPKRRILIDLKTAVSAEKRRFGIAAGRLGYHMQMSVYANGIYHALGWKPEAVKIIVVEKNPPHEVSIFPVKAEDIMLAADEVSGLLRQVKACRQTNLWPGRYLEEQELQLPAYIYGETEFEYE